MSIFTKKQWFVVAVGGVVGLVALYYGLGYGLWVSLGLEIMLIAVAVGAQAWKISQTTRQ
jgi:hypothetical protein